MLEADEGWGPFVGGGGINMSFSFFWLHCEACGIFVPRPGIEPIALAVNAQSPNHWTTREFPKATTLILVQFLKSEIILNQTRENSN